MAEGGSESLSNIWGTGELNGVRKAAVEEKTARQQSMDESRGRMTLVSRGLGTAGSIEKCAV